MTDPQANRTQAARAIIGLGTGTHTHSEDDTADNRLDATVTAQAGVTEMEADIVALEAADALKAPIASLAAYPIAGADNTVSHDYTATGVAVTSTVFAALAIKTDGSVVAAVAGTITPGANKITVAGGADLSLYNLVFLVVK